MRTEARKKSQHQNYLDNRMERLARAKLYRESHRAEVVAGTRRWKAAHREELNASARAAYTTKAEQRLLARIAEHEAWRFMTQDQRAAIAIKRQQDSTPLRGVGMEGE